jgi:hypothetical protein
VGALEVCHEAFQAGRFDRSKIVFFKAFIQRGDGAAPAADLNVEPASQRSRRLQLMHPDGLMAMFRENDPSGTGKRILLDEYFYIPFRQIFSRAHCILAVFVLFETIIRSLCRYIITDDFTILANDGAADARSFWPGKIFIAAELLGSYCV